MFDYKPGDIFGCMADLGWITGHSYVVYGPLCNGATTVLFEGTPHYPACGMIIACSYNYPIPSRNVSYKNDHIITFVCNIVMFTIEVPFI